MNCGILRNVYAAVVLSAAFVSANGYGFGDVGHMTVCEMAFQLSTQTTKDEILKITNGVPFAQQCVWPDQVKKTKSWNSTSGYHFINYNDGQVWMPSDVFVGKDPMTGLPTSEHRPGVGDMVQMADRSLNQLRPLSTNDPSERKQKLCYLRFAGHLAGDTHQPLHAGRVVDRGGNNVKVTFNDYQFYPVRSLMIQTKDPKCLETIFEPSSACLYSETLMVERRNAMGEIIMENNIPKMDFVENNVHTMWDDVLIDHHLKVLGIVEPAKFNERDVLSIFQEFAKHLLPKTIDRGTELRSIMYDDVLRWVETANQHRELAYSTTGAENTDEYYRARINIIIDLLQRAAYRLAGALNESLDRNYEAPSPQIAEYRTRRRHELKARFAAGRTTDFHTICDDLK